MIDPQNILVENRQRSDIGIDDMFVESIKTRLINPIVLRRQDDSIFLVAGERRLEALKKIGVNPLLENIHYRFFEDLDPHDAYIVELEENIKREDLSWRDQVTAFGTLHKMLGVSVEEVGRRAHIQRTTAYRWHMIYKNLATLNDCTGLEQAYNVLQLRAERKAADVVTSLINIGRDLTNGTQPAPQAPSPTNTADFNFNSPSGELDGQPSTDDAIPAPGDSGEAPTPKIIVLEPPPPEPQFILNLDFLDWIKTYSGPKFNVVHCDFPYGIDWESFNAAGKVRTKAEGDYENNPDLYWLLLDRFCSNLDKFVSYSAHVMFWFPMDYYESTRTLLEAVGLSVNKYPLVWYKSDGLGIMPGAQTRLYPRRLYETAFLCTRGGRTLVRALGNAYAAPHATNALHPSHKPEPMLKHFLGMLVDETSNVFDPTCGSGASIRVANELNARSVLGLEIDSHFAAIAQQSTLIAFNLGKILI